MKLSLFAMVGMIWLARSQVLCAKETPSRALANSFSTRFEEQYPFPVNVDSGLKTLLRKSRLGSRFILSVQDLRSSMTETIDDSTQTQLALTWSPNSQNLAWLEPLKSGCGFQLRLFNLTTKQAQDIRGVSTNNASAPLRFSPNGHYLAMVASSNLVVIDVWKPTKPPQVWLTGVNGGSDFVWTDNETLIVSPNDSSGALVIVNSDVRHQLPQFAKGTDIKQLSWSFDSKSLLASVRLPMDEYYSIFEFHSLSIHPKASIQHKKIIDGTKANAIRPMWLSKSESFAYISQLGDHQELFVSHRTKQIVASLESMIGEFDLIGSSQDRLMVVRSSQTKMSEVLEFDLMAPGAKSSTIQIIGRGVVKDLKEPNLTTLQAQDGVNFYLQHWLAPRKKNTPQRAIVWIHGGPHLRESAKWSAEISTVLSRGIDFIQVNYRGSTGYGRTFEALGNDSSRLLDIQKVISYLGKEHKIPEAEIVLAGSSYGGYLAAKYAQTNSDLRGLVMLSPGTFDVQTPVYSASTSSNKIFTAESAMPILLYQGQQDCVIQPLRGLQIVEGLLGKRLTTSQKSIVKIFPDEGHHFHRTRSRAEFWSETVRLFGYE